MKRFTNGVEGEFFHQKRVPANHPDYVDEVFVTFPSGHSTVFAIVDNAAALAWVANLGCIELHTWHSRVPEIERPDYLLIDLDPTTDGQWPFVREIALVVREVMDELGLRSYPKTSGATGLHILAPIKPELLFPDVRRFAKALADGGRAAHRRPGDRDDDVARRRSRRRVRRLRPERARPHDRVRVLGAADAGRARLGAAPLGRGRGRRAGGVHARDDGGADRGGRRSDARHVAQPAVAAQPVREARPRASIGFVTRPNTALKSASVRVGSMRRLRPPRGLSPRSSRRPTAANASPYIRYGVQDDAWLEYGPGTLDTASTGSTRSASTSSA